MTTNTLRSAFALFVLAALTVGGTGEAAAQTWASDGFYEPDTVGFRLGLGMFSFTEQTQDSTGKISNENHFGGSVLLGGSYAVLSRVALDLDTNVDFEISPKFKQRQVGLTPGTRLFLFPGFYGRLASMNYVMSPINSLALVGAGYFTSTGAVSFFIELNYVAWALKDDDAHPVPLIIPRLGLSVGF